MTISRELIIREALAAVREIAEAGKAGDPLASLPKDVDSNWGWLQTMWPVVVGVDTTLAAISDAAIQAATSAPSRTAKRTGYETVSSAGGEHSQKITARAALTTPQEAKSAAKVVPVSYEASASCSHGACPSGCSHLMWECSACSCEGGWGASRERLEEFAAKHECRPAPQEACTCPSGDGSLQWPCPTHPPAPQEGDARERMIDVLVMTDLSDYAGTDMGMINAAFIASARSSVPRLIAALEAVREVADAYGRQPDVMEPCGAAAQSIRFAIEDALKGESDDPMP